MQSTIPQCDALTVWRYLLLLRTNARSFSQIETNLDVNVRTNIEFFIEQAYRTQKVMQIKHFWSAMSLVNSLELIYAPLSTCARTRRDSAAATLGIYRNIIIISKSFLDKIIDFQFLLITNDKCQSYRSARHRLESEGSTMQQSSGNPPGGYRLKARSYQVQCRAVHPHITPYVGLMRDTTKSAQKINLNENVIYERKIFNEEIKQHILLLE